MTIRELIHRLNQIRHQYGDDWLVMTIDGEAGVVARVNTVGAEQTGRSTGGEGVVWLHVNEV